MPVTISIKREFDLIGNDNNNDPCIFARDPSNLIFASAFEFKTKIVDDSQPTRYLAFPFVVKIGSSLIGIFSENDAHAVGSSGQWMIRSDDDGVTWQKVKFFDVAVPNVYDTSLLTDLLPSGQTVVLKIFSVTNTAGVFTVTTQSTAALAGNNYALWSKAIPGAAGKLWRTGYGTVSGATQTALFESADNGVTWTGVSVMFAAAGRNFSEADIVNLNGTAWLAIAREDLTSATTNSLYYSVSTDDGATWPAPVLLTQTRINGRQPNLIKTTNGNIIFSSGDRKTGASGYGGNGVITPYSYDTTGVCVYSSPKSLLGSNPLTTSGGAGTKTIVVTHTAHGLETGDVIYMYGATTFDGIPAVELNKLQTITRLSSNTYSFLVTTGATTGGVSGGGSAVNVYGISRWGFRTRIAGMYSSDGGQPFTNEISTANYINTVFYHRRAISENPIIASATLFAPNL